MPKFKIAACSLVFLGTTAQAAVLEFEQAIGAYEYRYSIDDQALTLALEPFEASVALTDGMHTPPQTVGEPPFTIRGGLVFHDEYNTPGKLPLETTVIHHEVRSTIQMDFVVDSGARLVISGGGGDPIPFTIPRRGTYAALNVPDFRAVLEGVRAVGSWTIEGDGDEFYSGVFDVPLIYPNSQWDAYGLGDISQVNLRPYPSSAPLVGYDFRSGRIITPETPLFSGVVSTLPFSLSLGGRSVVILADGTVSAPVPLPSSLLLLPTAIAFVATRLRRRSTASRTA